MADSTQSSSQDPELQQINLLVEGRQIPIRVPRDAEPSYRRAQDRISDAIGRFRQLYPQFAQDEQIYCIMAAIEIAVQYEQLEESGDASLLKQSVAELNDLIEAQLQ